MPKDGQDAEFKEPSNIYKCSHKGPRICRETVPKVPFHRPISASLLEASFFHPGSFSCNIEVPWWTLFFTNKSPQSTASPDECILVYSSRHGAVWFPLPEHDSLLCALIQNRGESIEIISSNLGSSSVKAVLVTALVHTWQQ